MATTENVPDASAMQLHLVWVIGQLAILVSVVLAVCFAYANAHTITDALIRVAAAAVVATTWKYRQPWARAWSSVLLAALGFVICLPVTLAGGIGTMTAGSGKSLATREKAEGWNGKKLV